MACALSSDEAFAGYWQRPDADARQIRDGWYFPGDLGQLDADGDLYLVGRIDDMIVSGGENVHPLEIEEWLVRHPGVRRGGRRGRGRTSASASASWPTSSCAGRGHARTRSTRTASPRRRSPRFKRPRDYRFVDALPEERVGQAPAPPAAHDRGNHMTEYDGFRVARETDRGVATITLDVPEKFNRVRWGARRARAGVRASSAPTTAVRVIVLTRRRRARRSRPAATSACSWSATPEDALAPARERRRAGALPQARDRAAPRLLLRRRARARAGVRLPRGERRRRSSRCPS